MAKIKGICKNFDNCTKADANEVQEVESTEFVCAECGKPLEEVYGSGPGTSTDPKGRKKLPLIIGGAVILAGLGAGGYFLTSGNKDKKAEAERMERIADSLRLAKEAENQQRIADSISFAEAQMKAEQQRIADSIAAANQKPTQAQSSQTNSSTNWNGVATYSGPMQGGKPNGFGGTLTFKSNYQLDLKDGNGTKLDIKAGETIVNTKFENGKLRQGELRRKDGTRKWFNI